MAPGQIYPGLIAFRVSIVASLPCLPAAQDIPALYGA